MSGPRRFAVVGAGAIGGFLAGRLARAGHAVTVVARGDHLAAMRREGIALERDDAATETAPVEAVARIEDVGTPDVAIVTLKAHQLPPLADALGALAGRSGLLAPIQNGIPWWTLQRFEGPLSGGRIESVDPGGRLLAAIPLERIVPGFAFKAAEVVAPGRIRHVATDLDAFPFGELDGRRTERLRGLVDALVAAGVPAVASGDIRETGFSKLIGNVFVNPIAALTGAGVSEIASHPRTVRIARMAIEETLAVAAALGIPVATTPDERLRRARAVGPVRASMLQDRLAGRPPEHEAILGTLVELAAQLGIPVPAVATLHGLVSLLAEREGLVPAIDKPETSAKNGKRSF